MEKALTVESRMRLGSGLTSKSPLEYSKGVLHMFLHDIAATRPALPDSLFELGERLIEGFCAKSVLGHRLDL